MYGFAKQMYFEMKAAGNKSTGDRSLRRLLESPAIMASGFQQTFYQKIPLRYVID